MSITIGDTLATPAVLETFLYSVWRRGSVTRGSLWAELEEPLDGLEPEGGCELGEPDCELEEPDADLEPDDVDVPDLEPDALDVLLDEPDFPDVDEPDPLDVLLDDADFEDVDELEEEDAGLAGVPSFAAISNGPVTPGPKYFAVRS